VRDGRRRAALQRDAAGPFPQPGRDVRSARGRQGALLRPAAPHRAGVAAAGILVTTQSPSQGRGEFPLFHVPCRARRTSSSAIVSTQRRWSASMCVARLEKTLFRLRQGSDSSLADTMSQHAHADPAARVAADSAPGAAPGRSTRQARRARKRAPAQPQQRHHRQPPARQARTTTGPLGRSRSPSPQH